MLPELAEWTQIWLTRISGGPVFRGAQRISGQIQDTSLHEFGSRQIWTDSWHFLFSNT